MSAAFFCYVWLCGVYVGVVLSNEILTPPSSRGGVKALSSQG
jgi:hypothetical protein